MRLPEYPQELRAQELTLFYLQLAKYSGMHSHLGLFYRSMYEKYKNLSIEWKTWEIIDIIEKQRYTNSPEMLSRITLDNGILALKRYLQHGDNTPETNVNVNFLERKTLRKLMALSGLDSLATDEEIWSEIPDQVPVNYKINKGLELSEDLFAFTQFPNENRVNIVINWILAAPGFNLVDTSARQNLLSDPVAFNNLH